MISLEVRKLDVDSAQITRVMHPQHTILLTCINGNGKTNIMTIAWYTPVSFDPPLVAISISPERHSYGMIRETGEFVINIPTMDLVKETLFCGRRSGKQHDKFKETGLTPLPSKRVKPPIIKECVAHVECKLLKQMTVGDHEILVGEVLAAYANEGFFNDGYNLHKVSPIFHVAGDDFATLVPKIVSPARAGRT